MNSNKDKKSIITCPRLDTAIKLPYQRPTLQPQGGWSFVTAENSVPSGLDYFRPPSF